MKSHASLFVLFGLIAGCTAQVGEHADPAEIDRTTAAYTSPRKPLPFRAVTGDFDGDHKIDTGVKMDNGVFFINYGKDGYAFPPFASVDGWDARFGGYGPLTSVPTLADYDHDGKTDLSVKEPSSGTWFIDYARDGFGSWNESHAGYGGATAIPVPGDYDGDAYADLSVKDASGYWYVDYAKNGFGKWDLALPGYGPSSSIPTPADYDGDGRMDLSVKGSDGIWHIDYAKNGFGVWDWSGAGYGNNANQLVPADYDGDKKADISIKVDDGNWFVDYAVNGFGSWDLQVGGHGASSRAQAIPADYDFDGKADMAVDDEQWHVDFARNGFSPSGTWENVPYYGVPIPPTPTGLRVIYKAGYGYEFMWNDPVPYAETLWFEQFIPGHTSVVQTLDLTDPNAEAVDPTGYDGTICFTMWSGNGAGGSWQAPTFCDDGANAPVSQIAPIMARSATRSTLASP